MIADFRKFTYDKRLEECGLIKLNKGYLIETFKLMTNIEIIPFLRFVQLANSRVEEYEDTGRNSSGHLKALLCKDFSAAK